MIDDAFITAVLAITCVVLLTILGFYGLVRWCLAGPDALEEVGR